MTRYDLSIAGGYPLLDGRRVPKIAFGTFSLEQGAQTEAAVLDALEVGYRHIDCARLYGNERSVGRAIKDSAIPRDELFITSKVWNDRQIDGTVRESVEESLADLGVDQLDLLLVHWPVEGHFQQTWELFQQLQEEGLAKSIGVSNHQVKHLEQLLAGGGAVPVVNQMEHHPYMQDSETRAFCRNRGIVYEAWSPLGRGTCLDNRTICDIAQAHGATPAQVVVAWMVRRDVVPLPRSKNPERIRLNVEMLEEPLTEGECIRIDALNKNRYLMRDVTPKTFNATLNTISSHF